MGSHSQVRDRGTLCPVARLRWTSAQRWKAKKPAETQTMTSGSSASAPAGGAAALSHAARPRRSTVADTPAEYSRCTRSSAHHARSRSSSFLQVLQALL